MGLAYMIMGGNKAFFAVLARSRDFKIIKFSEYIAVGGAFIVTGRAITPDSLNELWVRSPFLTGSERPYFPGAV